MRVPIVRTGLALVLGLICLGRGQEPLRPLMRDFMGINGHTVQFKPRLYAPVGQLVRDYHPVEWDLGEETSVLPTFPEAKNRVNWESVYGSWKKEGFVIDACLMFESVPRENWKNLSADARAYGQYFAKKFGPSSRRELVNSVEIGNEPGRWSDADYAIIFAAMAGGIREGDPKLTIATCNLVVGSSHDYAKSVDCLAGLEKLYDVLTIHTYAQLEGWPTWKRSYPEDPRLKEYLKDVDKLCRWRDEKARGKAVWITEFGYDSSSKTPVKEDEFQKWEGVSDRQQAQWLLRSFLVFSTMPVERAYLYFFNDDDEPRLHASAGLTRDFVPKPSYYAVSHLYRTLGNYRFQRTIQNDSELRVLEYGEGTDAGGKIWVLWSPTGADVEKEVNLAGLPGAIARMERMPLRDVESAEDPGFANTEPGRARVKISESPAYLFFAKPGP